MMLLMLSAMLYFMPLRCHAAANIFAAADAALMLLMLTDT